MADRPPHRSFAKFWPLGMDSLTSPDALPVGAYVCGLNTINTGGIPQTRPGSRSFPCLPRGNLQGFKTFTPRTGVAHHVAAVDGAIYVSPQPFRFWRRLTGLQFNPTSPFVHMTPALVSVGNDATGVPYPLEEPYRVLIIQDGRTRAAFWDGAVARHTNPTPSNQDLTVEGLDEIKIGLWGIYSNNRYWVSRGRLVFASDFGNPLKFHESTYLNEVPFFILPDECTGMIETDDQSGILCFYEGGADFIETSVQKRTEWLNVTNIQRHALKVGCVAPRSLVNQHGLIYWFSPKGFTPIDEALRANQTSTFSPIDLRMMASKAYIGPDLSGICAGQFGNMLTVSVPYCSRENTHTWALDLSVLENGQKAWAGIWTGWRPVEWSTETIDGHERCFFASRDTDGANRVWEAFLGERKDNGCDITASVQLGIEMFGNDEQKRCNFAEYDLVQIGDDVSTCAAVAGPRGFFDRLVTKEIRTVQRRIDPLVQYGDGLTAPLLGAGRLQSRRIRTEEWREPSPCNVCGTESQTRVDIDYGFSLFIAWSGRAALKSVRLFANAWDENEDRGGCEQNETVATILDSAGCGSTEENPVPSEAPGWPVFVAYSHASGVGLENPAVELTVDVCGRSQISLVDAQRRATCKATRQLAHLQLAQASELMDGTFVSGCLTIVVGLGVPQLVLYNEDGTIEIEDLVAFAEANIGLGNLLVIRLVNEGTKTLVITGVEIEGDSFEVVSGPTSSAIAAGDFALLTLRYSPAPPQT